LLKIGKFAELVKKINRSPLCGSKTGRLFEAEDRTPLRGWETGPRYSADKQIATRWLKERTPSIRLVPLGTACMYRSNLIIFFKLLGSGL
jgi:hypothetical protein